MKKVLIRGPLLSKSGYGEHTRQVFRYLLSKPNIEVHTEILPWGITTWNIDESACGGLIGEAMRRSGAYNGKFDVSFQVQLPNEWDASKAHVNVGVTAGVETDVSNIMWANTHVMKMDRVIVPSQHAADSLAGNFEPAKRKINVVAESYYDELEIDNAEKIIDLKTDINFLTIGCLTGERPETDRKNLFFLIKWFIEEFKNSKDVGLIIKTSRGRNTAIDKYFTRNLLKNVLREIGHDGTPSIYLLHGDMCRKDMNNLYRDESIKAFISLTRGEGFGLPHLESAVAGLPVVATNWSAHKEFLDLGRWISIDYKLEPIHQNRIDNEIFVSGAKWAFPDEKDFKRKIRKLSKSYNVPRQWANDLSTALKEKYSWIAVSKQYEKSIGDLLE